MATQETKKVSLRCYAYPGINGGQEGYYAACIDLGLVTWRPTIQEAQKSLMDAIFGYMETVNDLIKEGRETNHLIPRRSPFWPYRLGYYAVSAISIIPRMRHAIKSISFKKLVDMPSNVIPV